MGQREKEAEPQKLKMVLESHRATSTGSEDTKGYSVCVCVWGVCGKMRVWGESLRVRLGFGSMSLNVI